MTLGAAVGFFSFNGLAQDPGLVDAGLSITGSGAHTYRVVPNWMEWPGGDPIGNTHGQIAIDSEGLVYIILEINL